MKRGLFAPVLRGVDCGGESCAAIARGLRASFDRPPLPEERAALLAYLRRL